LTRARIFLYKGYGEIKNIIGDWENMVSFAGLQPPLQPYAAAAHGYGHPNYIKDSDGIFRRKHLVAKLSVPVMEIRLQDITPDLKIDRYNLSASCMDRQIQQTAFYKVSVNGKNNRKPQKGNGTKSPFKNS